MNIIGTMFLVDEPHLDVLKQNLMTTPPPGGRLATGTMLCLDLDETDNMLEVWFPNHCQKATLLCPPPAAMYKEIDGDAEGFIQAYNQYLEYDDSVQEFIANILLFLHIGGNILIYTPCHIDDDAPWINALMMFFYTRYGITIGTSATNPASYDPRYDAEIAALIYMKGGMEVFDFINSYANPFPPREIVNKLCIDLTPYCAPGEDPMTAYNFILNSLMSGIPITKSAVTFRR